jgi:hypothetical protein
MVENNKELKLVDFFKPEGFNDRIILYFGSNNPKDYTGDKWDITPYEDIAGQVEQKVECKIQLYFNNYAVFQPVNNWSKNDLKNRKTPCLIIVPKQVFINDFNFDIDTTPAEERPWPLYDLCLGHESIVKIYYGDTSEEIMTKVGELLPL